MRRTVRAQTRSALAVVSALALGLGSALVAGPTAQAAPAKAPDVAKLAGKLAKQKLVWEKCDFGDDSYNERWANRDNVKCATVTVPRDWKNPKNGKTWSIRISQTTNIAANHPRSKGAILTNPGGPGGEGLVWGPAMDDFAPDLSPYYNFIGMDPRGIGQSSHASCEYSFDATSADPLAEVKAIGQQCAAHPDVKTINTEQTAYDMDFIRHLLGHKKLGYVGYSYGTWLGAWYGNVFGANAGPMLLDSATDVLRPTLQKTWELQPIARDRQFDMRMLHWIARHDGTYQLGTDPTAIKNRYFAATKDLDQLTLLLTWYLSGALSAFPANSQYPVAGEVVQALIEYGESEQPVADADLDPALVAQKVLANVNKDALQRKASPTSNALQQLAAAPQARAAQLTTKTFEEPFEMIRCGDGQWTQGERYWQAWATKTAPIAQLSNQWGALEVPVCAFWRTNQMMPVATSSYPKTIVVQAEMDSQTAWETGYTSGTKLPNTSAIFIDNEGSHGLFPYASECVDRPVINFFLDGRLPKNISVCQGLPLPQEDVTYENWAKLDPKGKHLPVAPGPFTPALTGVRKGSANALASQIGQAETTSQVKAQVSKRYGQTGVKILQEAGLLK